MALSIGIVGLPNVGKSTLFTALTNKGGLAANYPFATIEPNVGVVPVPDARLDELAKIDAGKQKLQDALKGTDTEAIKAASAELGEVFQTISARVYQETGADPTGAAGAAGGAAGGQDNVYDADYEVVDDDQQ